MEGWLLHVPNPRQGDPRTDRYWRPKSQAERDAIHALRMCWVTDPAEALAFARERDARIYIAQMGFGDDIQPRKVVWP